MQADGEGVMTWRKAWCDLVCVGSSLCQPCRRVRLSLAMIGLHHHLGVEFVKNTLPVK